MSDTATETSSSRGRRQTLIGMVVSDRMDKTVVVAVETRVNHALYKRHQKRTHRFYAHDESNQCGIGDRVEIVSSRPLSRLKRWRVGRVLQRAEG
jgi:small subunit ribosomal protein S17